MKSYPVSFKIARLTTINSQPAILLRFPYTPETINQIKTFKGFSYQSKKWTIPLTIDNAEQLKKFNFTLSEQLSGFIKNSTLLLKPIKIPGLGGVLLPFQNAGVQLIDQLQGCAILADEMGLGKTIQALAWLQLHPELRPAIIVVPGNLKLNWYFEAKQWIEYPKVRILTGMNSRENLIGEIFIVNYEILADWVDSLNTINSKVIILDEGHYFKNNDAIRTKAVFAIAKRIPNRIVLTGTPIEHRPKDVYNMWKLVNPIHCPPWNTFGIRYCGGFEANFNGVTKENLDELHSKLKLVMIRRLKIDVMPELPNKRLSIIPIEIDNRKDYKKAEGNFVELMNSIQLSDKSMRNWAFARIEELKQLASVGKLIQIKSWISDFIESGNKLVVFCTYKFMISELYYQFKEISVKLDGSTPVKNRKSVVDQFQNDPNIKLFIGMIDNEGRPAGVGITLTAAYSTATVGLLWGPKPHDQACDRVHRIGQKKAVINYFFLAQDTIEEKIAKIHDRKRKMIDTTIDNKETEVNEMIGELMQLYKNN